MVLNVAIGSAEAFRKSRPVLCLTWPGVEVDSRRAETLLFDCIPPTLKCGLYEHDANAKPLQQNNGALPQIPPP